MIIWRIHIDFGEAKALKKFLRVCSVFKSERFSAIIKLTLYAEFTRSSSDLCLPCLGICGRHPSLKLQCLQNKVLHTIVNFQRCTPVLNLDVY
jgi:hypothetical protein